MYAKALEWPSSHSKTHPEGHGNRGVIVRHSVPVDSGTSVGRPATNASDRWRRATLALYCRRAVKERVTGEGKDERMRFDDDRVCFDHLGC